MRFHKLIAEATGNGALHYVVQQLWRFRKESDIWRLIDERTGVAAMQNRAVEEHVKIYAALDAQNAKAAHDAMREHIQNNIEWRLEGGLEVPAKSERDRRTKLRLLLERCSPAKPSR